MDSAPKLIETGVKHYMHVVLDKCYHNRLQFYSAALNVGVLVVFLLVAGVTLWYCHTKKLTPYELERNMKRDQQYVLSKIRHFQAQKQLQNEQISQITSLPGMR